MKRIFLSIIMAISFQQLSAQLDYFVFIQETSGQPFYVRIGEDSHSSSAEGHLILSKLKDSVYNLYLGFAKSIYPEQQFMVEMNKKDRGFELKNTNGSWELLDLQSLEILKPVAAAGKNNNTDKKTDSYSNLMAGLVDDTAVLYNSAEKEEVVNKKDTLNSSEIANKMDTLKSAEVVTQVKVEKKAVKNKRRPAKVAEKKDIGGKPAENRDVAAKDSATANAVGTKTEGTDTLAQTAVAGGAEIKSSVRDKRDIVRYLTENVAGGKLMIYLDRSGEATDTIRIIIPHL